MTTKSEIVVALDIGTTKVCTLIGDVRGEDHIEILGAGMAPSHGMRKGVVVDIGATTSAVRQSVAAAAAAADVHVENVYVGVTGEHIASLTSRGCVAVEHEVREEDLQKAESSAGQVVLPPEREVLHNIPRRYIVDGQEGVRHPVGMSAARLEVESHVVTAATAFLENVAKAVHRAGLEIEDLVVEPLATGLAVLTDAERHLGVVLADIGGGTTDVALFSEGAISHTTIIPVGGSHVTHDLSVAFRVDPEQAERLKLAAGAVAVEQLEDRDEYVRIRMIGEEEPREIPRALLPQIIGPRMEELFELLREHVERAAGEGVYANSCVLSGGGSQIPGALELAERVLGMPVRLGKPREIIDPSGLAASPVHATAVGLLAFAARYHPYHSRRRSRGGHEPGAIGAGALALIAGWFRRLRRPKKRPPRAG